MKCAELSDNFADYGLCEEPSVDLKFKSCIFLKGYHIIHCPMHIWKSKIIVKIDTVLAILSNSRSEYASYSLKMTDHANKPNASNYVCAQDKNYSLQLVISSINLSIMHRVFWRRYQFLLIESLFILLIKVLTTACSSVGSVYQC